MNILTRRLKKWLTGLIFIGFVYSAGTTAEESGSGEFNNLGNSSGGPDILVATVSASVASTQMTNGIYQATLIFAVDTTETNRLNLSCIVSDLWIEGEDQNEVTPIPLNKVSGCLIEPADAIAHSGQNSAVADFESGSLMTEEGIEAIKTDYRTFTARDSASSFKQDVYLVLSWEQNEPLKPVGRYEGLVKLVAEIPEEGQPSQ